MRSRNRRSKFAPLVGWRLTQPRVGVWILNNCSVAWMLVPINWPCADAFRNCSRTIRKLMTGFGQRILLIMGCFCLPLLTSFHLRYDRPERTVINILFGCTRGLFRLLQRYRNGFQGTNASAVGTACTTRGTCRCSLFEQVESRFILGKYSISILPIREYKYLLKDSRIIFFCHLEVT